MEKERLKDFIKLRLDLENTINSMIDMKVVELNKEKKMVVLEFPIKSWELNPFDHLHGGIISTMIDITMSASAYSFSQASSTPTIQMAINFVKGVPDCSILCVEGYCDHVGSRMAQTRAIVKIKGKNEIVATANGSYAINNGKK